MANQFTIDPTRQNDPRQTMFGSSVNQGQGLPNLSPQKTPTFTPFTDALGRPINRIAQTPGSSTGYPPGMDSAINFFAGQGQAAQPGPSAPNVFQGQPSGQTAPDSQQSRDEFGGELKARAGGKRSALELQSDAMEAARAREQAASANRARLARYGFAPSSALGLNYANQTDRQVAELMDRRQMQREEQARTAYTDYLSSSEARRHTLAEEDYQRQSLAQQKDLEQVRLQQTQKNATADARRAAGGGVGKAAGGALGGFLGSSFGPAGTAAGSALGGALGDFIGRIF